MRETKRNSKDSRIACVRRKAALVKGASQIKPNAVIVVGSVVDSRLLLVEIVQRGVIASCTSVTCIRHEYIRIIFWTHLGQRRRPPKHFTKIEETDGNDSLELTWQR